MRNGGKGGRSVAIVALLVAWFGDPGIVRAFPEYASDGQGGAGCMECHGDFNSGSYVSPKDGANWGDTLMNVHATMVDSDCETCHSAGGRSPVLLNSSSGGAGLQPISCIGCHGRVGDGTGTGTAGYGAGLRQHHWRSAVTTCLDCHSDADPANKLTVGENALPPYYGAANFSAMPSNPCNPGPTFNESFAGTTLGLDNDGDDAYDTGDTDCGAAPPGPGEVASLAVTTRDPVAGTMGIRYTAGCATTDNTIEFGLLAQVSSHTYTGQVCNIGNTGSFTWAYPADSVFFLVVGNNGTIEGSYGTFGSGAERPEDTANVLCPITQDLTDECASR